MLKIEIKNRFTGKILFEYSKDNNTIAETLLKAIADGANLDGANLYGANLYGANLYGANLTRANLYGANLTRANLYGANLDGANLYGANLYGANLDGANLYGANLYGANLTRANLDGANLYGANLDPYKKDLFDVLLRAIPELPNFKAALIGGKIDGSTYEGPCACLCGTLMKSTDKVIVDRINVIKSASRPIEKFFANIHPGETPENNKYSKLALEWLEEFESYINPVTPC